MKKTLLLIVLLIVSFITFGCSIEDNTEGFVFDAEPLTITETLFDRFVNDPLRYFEYIIRVNKIVKEKEIYIDFIDEADALGVSPNEHLETIKTSDIKRYNIITKYYFPALSDYQNRRFYRSAKKYVQDYYEKYHQIYLENLDAYQEKKRIETHKDGIRQFFASYAKMMLDAQEERLMFIEVYDECKLLNMNFSDYIESFKEIDLEKYELLSKYDIETLDETYENYKRISKKFDKELYEEMYEEYNY